VKNLLKTAYYIINFENIWLNLKFKTSLTIKSQSISQSFDQKGNKGTKEVMA